MYAKLPKKAKPSKVASKDATRPALQQASLVCDDGNWTLLVTDSYKLVRLPVSVSNEAPGEVEAGIIPLDALKAVEKTGAFTANDAITPMDDIGRVAGPTYARTEQGPFPNCDNLIPVHGPNVLTLRFNPEHLWAMAQALGQAPNAKGSQATIELDVDLDLAKDGEYLKPFVVRRPVGGDGLLMPIRK
jgi:hypothetical protein